MSAQEVGPFCADRETAALMQVNHEKSGNKAERPLIGVKECVGAPEYTFGGHEPVKVISNEGSLIDTGSQAADILEREHKPPRFALQASVVRLAVLPPK